MIPIYQPHQFSQSVEYAKKAIDSNWISSQGGYLDSCKETFKNKLEVAKHFESDKQYEVAWPDLSKPDYRTAVELSTPELYGYMLSINKN